MIGFTFVQAMIWTIHDTCRDILIKEYQDGDQDRRTCGCKPRPCWQRKQINGPPTAIGGAEYIWRR